MNNKLLCILLFGSLFLGGCQAATPPQSFSPIGAPQITGTIQNCPDSKGIIQQFFSANDSSLYPISLGMLTDDVALITWAEGANGHHMSSNYAVGKDQVVDFLSRPGLKRVLNLPDLPNYNLEFVQSGAEKTIVVLNPDRKHPGGRPYNAYRVEFVFSGCKIELIKVVERISWL